MTIIIKTCSSHRSDPTTTQEGQLQFQYKGLAQELILDSDSDGHTFEDDISHPHSNSDKEGEDTTETEYNEHSDSTQP